MKKCLLFAILFPFLMFSQSRDITGNVTGKNGLPLPGVTVVVKGTNNLGAVTDFDGNFSISIPQGATNVLVFSYIGYAEQEVDVSSNTNIKVILEEDLTELDEVVVVGYGSVLKKDITGSVTSVTVEDDIARQANSVDQLLQGRTSGVQVIQNSAAVGSGISVKIRGASSIQGSNEPLYVIDGVIIASAGEDVDGGFGVGNSGQDPQNGLNGINPRDIESIQVLKDASATAIYGSRGANGVILITTKQGKSGKPKINAFMTTTTRTITKKIDVLDGMGYALYRNELQETAGEEPDYQINGNNIFSIWNNSQGEPVVGTTPLLQFNWQDEMYRTGFGTNAGATISGGSENGNYYISAGFNNQDGLITSSNFKSGDIRVNINQNLTDKLKIKARLSGFFAGYDFAEGGDLFGGSNRSMVRNFIQARPLVGTNQFEEDLQEDAANPFTFVEDFYDNSNERRYVGSVSLNYKLPLKGLSYEVKLGGNTRTKERRRFYGLATWVGSTANGAMQISNIQSSSYQINNLLRFNRKFNNKHRFNAVLGVTYDVRKVDRSIYAVEDFATTDLNIRQPGLGQVITQPLFFNDSEQQIFSTLGRLNYTLNNKYTFTGTFRYDGVSKFQPGKRYGFFPSFAVAWNVANEKFLKKLNIFKEFKLRTGWGQIGNHGIGPYGTISRYGTNNPPDLYGTPSNGTTVPFILPNIANPDLTWETTEQLNFGLDFSTKKGELSGNIDVYEKKSIDLLQPIEIPLSSGFSTLLVNRGEITNKGVELSLNYNIISKDDMQFSIGGNISLNRSEVVKTGVVPGELAVDGIIENRAHYFGRGITRANTFRYPANIFVDGEEIGLFYGLKTNGIYQSEDTDIPSGYQPGDVRLVDLNNDGEINGDDRTFIGNPNPDFIYGFNMTFNYKRFSSSFLFNGVYGNDIVNGNNLVLDNAVGSSRNIKPEAYYNAWRPDAQSNTTPRIGYTTENDLYMNDRIVEGGSYLRLNNVTLGYDIPVETSKVFEKVKIFVTGQNLFTWTNYSGYDPEVTTFLYTGLIQGVDWNNAPNSRNFLLGVNINF